MTRRVLLYPGEDGYVVAEVPSLPGCISQGKTREEALENVREAISQHEEVLRELGEPIDPHVTYPYRALAIHGTAKPVYVKLQGR